MNYTFIFTHTHTHTHTHTYIYIYIYIYTQLFQIHAHSKLIFKILHAEKDFHIIRHMKKSLFSYAHEQVLPIRTDMNYTNS